MPPRASTDALGRGSMGRTDLDGELLPTPGYDTGPATWAAS